MMVLFFILLSTSVVAASDEPGLVFSPQMGAYWNHGSTFIIGSCASIYAPNDLGFTIGAGMGAYKMVNKGGAFELLLKAKVAFVGGASVGPAWENYHLGVAGDLWIPFVRLRFSSVDQNISVGLLFMVPIANYDQLGCFMCGYH